MRKLNDYIATYQNTAFDNDSTYDYFTTQIDNFPSLKGHRDFIELNKLGFGERAFHSMWKMILDHLISEFEEPKILEIGVYMGQVISLWSLIARELNVKIKVTGITPLEGNPIPKNKLLISLISKVSKKFRKNLTSGNFYGNEDYQKIIESIFERFKLDLNSVRLIKGYSNDPKILADLKENMFHTIYIDGDHTFEGVKNDIINYSKLIIKNGLLIMDDASCNIPSTKFWKGHQSVSDACEIIESLGFENILNVGHNRVYKKL